MSVVDDHKSLLLLGVGGGGCSLAAAVLNAYRGGDMRAVGFDTDALANRQAGEQGLVCHLLGGARLAGNGAGGDAIKGRFAAQDDIHLLESHMQGVRTVVVTACLGAGTGGGATPEIIKALHGSGLATLCFVTLPFGFEGDARRESAMRMLPMIEEHADTLVAMPLDDLFSASSCEPLDGAIRSAQATLAAGVTLLWRLLTRPGFIRVDPERLRAMILRGGNACFASASAAGEDRAAQVVEQLRGSRLLRRNDALVRGGAFLVGILGGRDVRLMEIGAIMEGLRALRRNDCRVEMGTVLDDEYDGRIEVVVLAFENGTPASMPGASAEQPAAPLPPIAESLPIRSGSSIRKGQAKNTKLGFGASGRGRFHQVEPTFHQNMDLDVPTFMRRSLQLER